MDRKCIVCSRIIINHNERYLVKGKGKFNVAEELYSLSFNRENPSEHICKTCRALLKKRRGLSEQLAKVENELQELFKTPAYSATEHPGFKRSATDINEASTTPKKSRLEDEQGPTTSTPLKVCSTNASQTLTQTVETPQQQDTKRLKHLNNKELGELSPIAAKQPVKEKQNVDVRVKIQWPTKDKERKLPEDLESLGKMLVRGTYKQIANAAWKSPCLKQELTVLILKEVEKESTGLCSKKRPSCLRMTDEASMLSFSMEKFEEELKERAPLFHSILSAASINSHSRAKGPLKASFGPIGMAAAVCMKNRSKFMTAVQLLITMFLYHSSWMVSAYNTS